MFIISSILINSFHLDVLSLLEKEPTLIISFSQAIAKWLKKLSSVSPDLADKIVLILLCLANLIVSKVSVIVPHWFILIIIALTAFWLIAFLRRSCLVQIKSSPTIPTNWLYWLWRFAKEMISSSWYGSSIKLTLSFLINLS